MSLDSFAEAQVNDVAINRISNKPKFIRIRGIICARSNGKIFTQSKYLPIIPKSILEAYTRSLHYSPKWFHQTPQQILNVIKREFYVVDPGVVYKEIEKCYPCLVNTHDMSIGQTFAEDEVPTKIRTDLSFDIVCGLSRTDSGYKYILAVVDNCSNYFITCPSKTRTSKEIIDFFRNVIFTYCIPVRLRLDQELSLLASAEFRKFCQFYDIIPQIVSTRYSQSNGRIERMFYFLKKSCRIVSTSNYGEWNEYLPYITQSINSKICIYGYSSEELTFFNVTRNITPITMDGNNPNTENFVQEMVGKIKKDARSSY